MWDGAVHIICMGRGTKMGNWDDDTTRHFSTGVLSRNSKCPAVARGCEPPEDPKFISAKQPLPILFLCLVASAAATTHLLSTYCVLYTHLI